MRRVTTPAASRSRAVRLAVDRATLVYVFPRELCKLIMRRERVHPCLRRRFSLVRLLWCLCRASIHEYDCPVAVSWYRLADYQIKNNCKRITAVSATPRMQHEHLSTARFQTRRTQACGRVSVFDTASVRPCSNWPSKFPQKRSSKHDRASSARVIPLATWYSPGIVDPAAR